MIIPSIVVIAKRRTCGYSTITCGYSTIFTNSEPETVSFPKTGILPGPDNNSLHIIHAASGKVPETYGCTGSSLIDNRVYTIF